MNNNGQHSRRLDAVARRLTGPEKQITIEHVSQAIAELEAAPDRTHLVGMPRARFMALVTDETERLLGNT